ncbi:MAG: pteridine reductase [Gammaproteobacteria bacterium]|nr:pteridine reductase [Gammaproteobacteria bacterium]
MSADTPVALITGAARRLGAATARALHERGYRVLLHCRQHPAEAAALAHALNRVRAQSAQVVQADLANRDEVRALAHTATHHWGRLDVLVNNASAFRPTPIDSSTDQDWDELLHTNLRAPYLLIQGCLPALRAQRGSIVNLIDVYAQRPLPNHPLYCASKAGLAMLTQALARDLAPEIRVNGVSPGAILWPEGDTPIDPVYQQSILAKTPLARTGTPDDIARAVCWLACDAPFVTGQILAIDGGRSLNI